MRQKGILYWITGLSGAGKTTIGNRLYYELKRKYNNVIILDGDILKYVVTDNLEYTKEDRKKRAIKYALLCKILTDQDIIVICCTIAMFDDVRDWNRKNNKCYVEIFLDVGMDVLKKRDQKGMYSKLERGELKDVSGLDLDVEFPKDPDIIIQNDGRYTVRECVNKILNYKVISSSDFDRDTDYWNQYYENKHDMEYPSLFAQNIGTQLRKNSSILDLGCGNGRDSLYFYKLGLNVTAIDASDSAIRILQKKYYNESLYFICDDFVCSSMIYMGQYDYVYSRFSLHAISEEQENQVLKNVYKVLKEGGTFFVEARSINDELFEKGRKVDENAYIYQGHFRRFLNREKLEEKLGAIGFTIEYSKEQRGFAPFGKDDPPIIRMILKK